MAVQLKKESIQLHTTYLIVVEIHLQGMKGMKENFQKREISGKNVQLGKYPEKANIGKKQYLDYVTN
jgi:hypothetical protein